MGPDFSLSPSIFYVGMLNLTPLRQHIDIAALSEAGEVMQVHKYRVWQCVWVLLLQAYRSLFSLSCKVAKEATFLYLFFSFSLLFFLGASPDDLTIKEGN